jgi:hypothetical protein
MVGDIVKSYDILILTFFLAILAAFLITTLLRKDKGIKIAVWGSLGMSIIILELIGYYS